MLFVLSTTILSAAEGPDQPDLPKSLAIGEVITMTDADESYASTVLRQFKLPDERSWTFTADAAYGLTDRWRVYAEVPYSWVDPYEGSSAHGIGDVETSGELQSVRSPARLDGCCFVSSCQRPEF